MPRFVGAFFVLRREDQDRSFPAESYLIRGQRVVLDYDLAELYQVETRALVQAVKRNIDRFPSDFLFQLTGEETESLRSQIVIS